MIIETESQTRVTRIRILKFKCERCQKIYGAGEDHSWEPNEALELVIHGGYGSRYIGDQNVATTVLCQDCVWELLGPYLHIEGDRPGEDWREWTAEEVKEMQDYHKAQHDDWLKRNTKKERRLSKAKKTDDSKS